MWVDAAPGVSHSIVACGLLGLVRPACLCAVAAVVWRVFDDGGALYDMYHLAAADCSFVVSGGSALYTAWLWCGAGAGGGGLRLCAADILWLSDALVLCAYVLLITGLVGQY